MANYRTNHGGLDIHVPSDETDHKIDRERVLDELDDIELSDDAITQTDSAFVQRFEVDDGILRIGVWEGGSQDNGWYAHVEVPLLANDDAREVITELAKPYGLLGGQLADVTEVVEREVDDYGRINLGTERSGETVKVALLENE